MLRGVQLILFIVQSIPAVIKALKAVFDLVKGDKEQAKVCVDKLCQVEELKKHLG